ncbi:MAG: (2Fe-2S) ferredoxin domain-containing protein [Bacteroidetes bacterium]|jgi:(2Fe-2S) ferredoxin|nr:(2Fe-2S) ferredoxin domain-containing protein [Bacteroidota bacterium]
MKKPDYHILMCKSFRLAGEAQGVCDKKGASDLVQYISDECTDRGLDATVSTTGCLNVCTKGPVMVVHPNNLWYGGVESEEIVDTILDALEEGESADEYLISE